MRDAGCIRFMQWALPRMHMRWPGFRKVRRQVCKRINRRIDQLHLADVNAYRTYLQIHSSEWDFLDSLCRITISRFYRDKGVFDALGNVVFPALAQRSIHRGDTVVRCWSAGCASGEEPYTLALVWDFVVQQDYPDVEFQIIATDVDDTLLGRAKRACYTKSSLKELSGEWLDRAFTRRGSTYCLDPGFRNKVNFFARDIRRGVPAGPFDMVLCRNLAFTYFDMDLQKKILEWIQDSLFEGGALVLGIHESLPDGVTGFCPWIPNMRIYRKYTDKG